MKAIPKKTAKEIMDEREVLYKAQEILCKYLEYVEAEISAYEKEGRFVSHKEMNEEEHYHWVDTVENIATWDESEVNNYKARLMARDILLVAIEGQ